MTPDIAALLARVEAFPIDGPDAPALPFAARLAREHGWPRPYADRVIREYKRFAVLAAAGRGPVCPSEDVDAAWHLHLTYTRSYWTRFCGEALGRPLHHEPTRGGSVEGEKHAAMYESTLAAYRAAFGEAPPADVWPPAAERFGIDLRHRVVNTARNWVIPKRPVVRTLQLAAALVAVAVLVPGCDGGLNPFNLVGVEFLVFFVPALLAAMAAGRLIRRALRSPGPYPGDEDQILTRDQAAFLAGGYPRLVAATVARLVSTGALKQDGETLTRGPETPADGFSPAERAVMSHVPTAKADQKKLRDAVEGAFGAEAARLEAEGYTLPPARQFAAGFAALVPVLLVVLLFGVPRLLTGLANGKNVGFLVAAIGIGLVVGLIIAFVGLRNLSRRGEAALHRTRDRNWGLNETVSPGADVGMAVALFGTIVLTGTAYAYLRDWYPRQVHSGSAGGCGSGCGTAGAGGCGGDGGGGGGGCGGCGGGGGD